MIEQGPIVITFAVVLLVLFAVGITVAWLKKRKSQSIYPPLPTGPDVLTGVELEARGEYVSTTNHGDWLDRIVVNSLAFKAQAIMRIGTEGVLVTRTGAPEIFIDRAAITETELTSGAAGKFVEREGLLVIAWNYGDTTVDTAFRFRQDADKVRAFDLLQTLPIRLEGDTSA